MKSCYRCISSWRWEQWHKQGTTVSANMVEICDSLRNLDLCVLHLKRTMGVVNITLMRIKFLAFSNDIIRTATLAHGDHVTLTMWCTIFQEQQPWIQATISALWMKSMWVHEFINKTERLTIELWQCTSLACQMASVKLKTECTSTSFIEPLCFVALIHNSCPWNVNTAH